MWSATEGRKGMARGVHGRTIIGGDLSEFQGGVGPGPGAVDQVPVRVTIR